MMSTKYVYSPPARGRTWIHRDGRVVGQVYWYNGQYCLAGNDIHPSRTLGSDEQAAIAIALRELEVESATHCGPYERLFGSETGQELERLETAAEVAYQEWRRCVEHPPYCRDDADAAAADAEEESALRSWEAALGQSNSAYLAAVAAKRQKSAA